MKYRKHIRLKGFDYSSGHYYFVTICTKNRQELFAPFVDLRYGHQLPDEIAVGIAGDVVAPLCGARQKMTEMVVDKLNQIPKYYPAEIDFYVIMPDHLHMIIDIRESGKVSLALIVKAFKSWVTVGAKEAAQSAAATEKPKPSVSIWQPNYYEHIIRSEGSLERIRNYVLHNPWIEYDEINWKIIDPS